MSNEEYIETRVNPFLETYKKISIKKQKLHFSYTLVMLILLICSITTYLLGYFIPILYNAMISISIILSACAIMFFILNYIMWHKFNINKALPKELEKQKYLYLTASIKDDNFVEICENLIHEGENI